MESLNHKTAQAHICKQCVIHFSDYTALTSIQQCLKCCSVSLSAPAHPSPVPRRRGWPSSPAAGRPAPRTPGAAGRGRPAAAAARRSPDTWRSGTRRTRSGPAGCLRGRGQKHACINYSSRLMEID